MFPTVHGGLMIGLRVSHFRFLDFFASKRNETEIVSLPLRFGETKHVFAIVLRSFWLPLHFVSKRNEGTP